MLTVLLGICLGGFSGATLNSSSTTIGAMEPFYNQRGGLAPCRQNTVYLHPHSLRPIRHTLLKPAAINHKQLPDTTAADLEQQQRTRQEEQQQQQQEPRVPRRLPPGWRKLPSQGSSRRSADDDEPGRAEGRPWKLEVKAMLQQLRTVALGVLAAALLVAVRYAAILHARSAPKEVL